MIFLLDFEFGFMHCCLKEHAEQSSHSYSLKSRLKPYLSLRYAYLLKPILLLLGHINSSLSSHKSKNRLYINFSLTIDFFRFWFRKLLINLGFKVFPIIILHDFLIGFRIWFHALLPQRTC